MKIRIAAALFVLILASNAFSQIPFSQADETNYTLGLQSFRQGDYSTAYQYFQQVMSDSLNQRSAESFYYGARTLFNLRRYQESITTIDTFLVRFPADEHRFEMFYILGANYYEVGRYRTAAAQFVTAIDSSADRVVRDRSVASLRTLVDFNLSFDDIETLFEQCHSRLSAVTVAIGFARRAYFSDKLSDADRILKEFRQRYPQSGAGSNEVARWIDRIAGDSALSQAQVKIGVLLPLEYGSGVGDKLLLGIQLALDNYNAAAQTKVGLVLKNYGGSLRNLDADMRALVKDGNVKAIVGPVFSNEVSDVAEIANSNRVPLITPTATQVGLTSGNPYVFQANPNFKTRARAIVDYAVNVLHIQKIAILSPSDSYGRTIANYFAERLRELGVKPVSTAYFESGTTDLSQQIGKIKEDAAALNEPYVDFGKLDRQEQMKLRAYGIAPAYLDSLVKSKGSIDAFDLFGENPKEVADSLGIPIVNRSTLGEFDALRSLGAIFVPLTSSKDIGIIGAQLAYYNVKTQLLGTDDWYDLNQLSNNELYVDGVIFCSDTYFNTSSPAYIAASDSLSQISDMDFDRTIAYGYDVMNMLLNAIKSGNSSRLDITNALRSDTYNGLHSTISFGGDNSNHYMHILQFKKGNIIDLGEVNTQQ
ncbi:MAG: penicillin-binding protein activator [Bacteroidetes bacterium]|nr:penicillin-binding protein activator [Bacteroidota bacterium]